MISLTLNVIRWGLSGREKSPHGDVVGGECKGQVVGCRLNFVILFMIYIWFRKRFKSIIR